MKERRIYQRDEPVEDCIVQHAKVTGNIKDISWGGVHCVCIQDSRACEMSAHKEIDILCGQGNFIVQGVRVKIIHMETISGKFLKNLELKKCRMQFQDLGDEQSDGIDYILAGRCLQYRSS